MLEVRRRLERKVIRGRSRLPLKGLPLASFASRISECLAVSGLQNRLLSLAVSYAWKGFSGLYSARPGATKTSLQALSRIEFNAAINLESRLLSCCGSMERENGVPLLGFGCFVGSLGSKEGREALFSLFVWCPAFSGK